jgi:hypothetical protein
MVLSILEIVLLMFVCIEIQDREWECVPNKVGIIVHGKLDSSVYLVAHTQTFTASNGPFMLALMAQQLSALSQGVSWVVELMRNDGEGMLFIIG